MSAGGAEMSAGGAEMLAAGAARSGAEVLRVAIDRKVYHPASADPVEAVRGLHFAVRAGEIVCLIGPSGAGKSTTLRILLGLDPDYEGRVEPDPRSDAHRPGMVFQEPRLLPWRSVEQNVRLAMPRRHRGRDLDGLFAHLGLTPWRGRYCGWRATRPAARCGAPASSRRWPATSSITCRPD